MHILNLASMYIVLVSFAHKGRGLRENAPTGEATAQQEGSEDEAQGITIDDLLKFVTLACQPNAPPQLVAQMHGLTQNLQSPEAPSEMHALGRVLAALVTGERHPDLFALPPELASKVREHLAAQS